MVQCGCDNCECEEDEKEAQHMSDADCGCNHDHKSTEQKLASLKKSITDLGYKVEETEEGIHISE